MEYETSNRKGKAGGKLVKWMAIGRWTQFFYLFLPQKYLRKPKLLWLFLIVFLLSQNWCQPGAWSIGKEAIIRGEIYNYGHCSGNSIHCTVACTNVVPG